MKKVFVLEDNQERINWFTQKFKGAQLTIATTAEYAERVFELECKEFDIIFLDHDLGGEIYVDSNNPNTGYQVAKYMVEHGVKGKEIIIHSLNYAGAQNMMALLPDAKYVPFTVLYSRM